ncbi:N-acetylglucosamine-6-phosphate deacetylase [Butyrivibrio sp. CB08]|uniref:N-acetylglucosamine-6-phosphate deacetylase n=1 Tax=Butyrivibrio sp. CB08 TaxID=2364879 RepID=UPI000EAA71CB|nr:N-acetylglucosamine-6-phosphate deacetylase [Butyrivibrio sp. CB08]RKM60605.1 N-acetylglucosamine-6-phosphate deacetylase [Butyrivibrio sp. CB08]
MKITGGEVYGVDRLFSKRDIYVKDGLIAEGCDDGEVLDASGCYVVPGFVDIHFHGAMGADVCDGTLEAYERIGKYELQNGITAMCPATLTLPVDELCKVLSLGAEYAMSDHPDGADLVGFNMEGPFISREKKGAQNEAYIMECDPAIVDRFVDSSKGLVKIIGLAPEVNPGFREYIQAVKGKIKVSLAHTGSDYETAAGAIEAGASHVVHLFNAMTGLNHRSPGVVGAAANYDSVTCEMILDGVHIHPGAARAAYKMMGRERIILISDSAQGTGMVDGDYTLGGLDVVKEGKFCRLKSDGTIAGSVSNLYDVFRTAVLEMNIPIEDVLDSCTINPARCIGVDDRYGSIETGKKADLLIIDKQTLKLSKIVKNGAKI